MCQSTTTALKKFIYGLGIIFVSYSIILLLASIISPVMFFVTRYLANTLSIPLFQHFIEAGFERFFNRSKLIAFIILIIPVCWINRLNFISDLKFVKISKKNFISMAACGLLSSCIILTCLVIKNEFAIKPLVIFDFIFKNCKFIFAATIIAVIEETLFRGIILQAFMKNMNAVAAVIISAIIFAFCHVGRCKFHIPATSVTIFSGFKCVFLSMCAIRDNFNLLNFFNLSMLGVLLSGLLLRFKSIFYPIAFHLGSVYAIMNVRSVIKIFRVSEFGIIQNINILDTWITFFLQTIFLVVLFVTRPSTSHNKSDDQI